MNDYPAKTSYTADDLVKIIALLRDPENGCPWDKVQTHQSIRMNFLEEAYEAVDAIDLEDSHLLCEELGDVLMQVVFHTQIEQEKGNFTWQEVCDGVCRKLIERHPHIFEDDLSSVPQALPALMRAAKLQKRAARYQVAVSAAPQMVEESAEMLQAAADEAAAEQAAGKLLFQAVALARKAGIDPEQALQRYNAAFTENPESN